MAGLEDQKTRVSEDQQGDTWKLRIRGSEDQQRQRDRGSEDQRISRAIRGPEDHGRAARNPNWRIRRPGGSEDQQGGARNRESEDQRISGVRGPEGQRIRGSAERPSEGPRITAGPPESLNWGIRRPGGVRGSAGRCEEQRTRGSEDQRRQRTRGSEDQRISRAAREHEDQDRAAREPNWRIRNPGEQRINRAMQGTVNQRIRGSAASEGSGSEDQRIGRAIPGPDDHGRIRKPGRGHRISRAVQGAENQRI
jgi:hypothetical protein